MQKRYWASMTQKRYSLYYVDEHFSRCILYDRCLSIFLAIVSSSSIAAWAIWNKFAMLWAILVAITHVITAIRDYLPYKIRAQEIANLKLKLVPICNDMEYNWYKVINGEMTGTEVNDLLHTFISQWSEAESKYLKLDSLPKNNTFEESAENKKDNYFKNNFKED